MVKKRKIIEKINPYVPGKSIEEIAKKYGLKKNDIIKLGSNENPLGPSPKVIDAIKQNLHEIHRYPESNINDLKKAIASYSGVSENEIIVGGDGADEIIDLLGKTFIEPGDEFIVPLPSYTYYEYALKPYGAKLVPASWDIKKNKLNVDSVLEKITNKTKLIFLCSPNNPTGGLIDKKEIKKILESTSALVIVDEAYFEFAGISNVDLLEKYPNILILRTFSKVLGLAGMRVGYGISNPEIISDMHKVKPIFSLTRLSYIAALTVLKDKKYIRNSINYIIKSREYLYEELSKFKEFKPLKSYANFILVDIRDSGMTSTEICEKLLKRGIIVRDCSSFRGLDEYWIRITVGKIEENKKLIDTLKEILH